MRKHQLIQQLGDHELRDQPQQTADAAGQQRQPQHFQREQLDDGPLRCTQTTQHRAGIEMAAGKAISHGSDRNAREQHTDQRGKTEKLLCPFQRRVEFRTTLLDGQDAFTLLQTVLDSPAIAVDRIAGPRDQHAVAHQRTGRDQAGGIEIRLVHQYTWRDTEHVTCTIRLIPEYLADFKAQCTEIDRIANFKIQHLQQSGFDPDITRSRYVSRRFIDTERRITDAEHTPQGIALGDCLDFRELQLFV